MKSNQLIQAGLLAALVLGVSGANATTASTKWHTECSSCHIAYPAAGLPAASWKKVMSSLDKHFGTDASLAPQDTQEIAGFLEKNASKRWGSNDAPLRLTDSPWWKSRHREVRAEVWTRASVKSHGNCGVCHSGADKGNFDEDSVRIPK